MAVKLRLQRGGRTNRSHFRVVAIDGRTRRDGKEIETLGSYDPFAKGESFIVNEERVKHWLARGAAPSKTVAEFLKRKGIELPRSTKGEQRKRKNKKRKAAAKA